MSHLEERYFEARVKVYGSAFGVNLTVCLEQDE